MTLPQNTTPIMQTPDFNLVLIGHDRLMECTEFVYGIYYKMFSALYGWQGDEKDKMYSDDLAYANQSTIVAALDSQGGIIASIRLLEKLEKKLPIEADFELDIEALMQSRGYKASRVYEAGRFARKTIPAEQANQRKCANKAVMAVIGGVIMQCTAQENTALFCTVDQYVYQMLQKRGFCFEQVAPSKMYIGSPTIPAFLDVEAWKAQNGTMNREAA